jgi:threonine dehydratase
VLSGGNIDPMLLLRVIEHGLASAGRFLRLAVRCDDRPGELARLLAEIAEQRANVVDVAHSRESPRLSFGEVEVALSVETRGRDHSAALISMLRGSGYRVALLSDATP